MDTLNKNTTDTILDSNNIVAEIEDLLENPSSLPAPLKYDSDEDPEYNEDNSSFRESFWYSYMIDTKMENKLNEAFSINNIIKQYYDENGKVDIEGLRDFLPSDNSGKYYKNHVDKLKLAVDKFLLKNQQIQVEKPVTFSKENLTSDLAKELYDDDDGDNLDFVRSAKDSADEKYENIYLIAKTIFQGKGIKHHAFIYGDPGIGKCVSYDEKIPVRMDDAIAEAYEVWLESRQK